jgi:hypothetical protein
VLAAGLGQVLDKIVREVEAANPSLVVVDSFRSVPQNRRRRICLAVCPAIGVAPDVLAGDVPGRRISRFGTGGQADLHGRGWRRVALSKVSSGNATPIRFDGYDLAE